MADADISRFERVIGGTPRPHIDQRRTTEMGIAVGALSRLLELGRPAYVRVG